MFCRVGCKRYHACERCDARFLDPACHPEPDVERTHYDLHENDPDDPRYRAFLSRLWAPLRHRLRETHAPTGFDILDYGCGPGPALAAMMREDGHRVALYDPVYIPDRKALENSYDVITCTEVVEHFHDPASEFAALDSMLRPGGWLAVMTCFQTDDTRFAAWHYRLDPTHVVFYRASTFRWLATHHGWSCEMPRKDVALMRKWQVP